MTERHPLGKFRFCPVCGSSLFEESNEKSKRCRACGFELFMNPSAAAAAFIRNAEGELLVCVRRCPPAKGTLDLPGGFCVIGESGEEGVRREVKEETGLDVVETRYLFSCPNTYLYSGFNVRTLDLFYLCKVKDCSHVEPHDDAQAYHWLPLSEIHTEQFGMRSIRQALTVFLQGRGK